MIRDHQRMRARAKRDDEVRGSMLLASMMTVSFAVLMFIGMTGSMLADRVRTDQVIQTAKALQLSHSGIEYALWEINYSDANYSDATDGTQLNWTALGGDQYRYTGIQNATVTVTDNGTAGDITISSQGSSPTILRTIQIKVPGRGPPAQSGIFDQLMYTADSNIYLNASGGGSLTLGGYNSSDPLNPPASSEVIIRSDVTPFHKTSCDSDPGSCAGLDSVDIAGVIMEGNVTANVKVVVRSPRPPSDPFPEVPDAGQATHGWFIQPNITVGGGLVPDPSSAPLGYTAKSKPSNFSNGNYILRPTDEGMICPGETWHGNEVYVEGGTMVLGCSLTPGDPYHCDTFQAKWDPIQERYLTCSEYDAAAVSAKAKVTILTGDSGDHGAAITDYNPTDPYEASGFGAALAVRSDPNNAAVLGQILVYTPTEIYYDLPGDAGYGLWIDSGGIENRVYKASEERDTAALVIYGGAGGASNSDNTYFKTTTRFDGAIFSPYSRVYFEGSMAFYGSLNVLQIRTSADVNIKWDASLPQVFQESVVPGTCDPSAHNCRPIIGSWSLTNQ